MNRSLVILIGALALGATIFAGSFLAARRATVACCVRPADDLSWLQTEFHLSDAEMARIRELHEGRTIAIATHGGVIRIVLAQALEMPDHRLFQLAQDYAAMNLVTWVDGVPIVRKMNLTASDTPTFPGD